MPSDINRTDRPTRLKPSINLPGPLHQALHTGAGMMSLHGLAFVTSILIARGLGPAGQGRFQVVLSIAVFATLVTTGGLDEGVAYLLPRYAIDKPEKIRALIMYALCTTAAVSILVGVVFFMQAGTVERLLRIAGISRDVKALVLLCPALMVLSMCLAVLRGVGRSDWRAYINYYLVGGLYFAAIAIFSSRGLTPLNAYAARIGSICIGAIIALVLIFRPRVGSAAALDRADLRKVHTFAGWLVFAGIFQYAVEQPLLDLLIVGRYDTTVTVGLYSVAAKAAGVIATGTLALNIVMAPVFARAAAERDTTFLLSQYRRASIWMAATTLILGTLVLLFRTEVLALFGGAYRSAAEILAIFAFAQLASGLLGINTPLLIACDCAPIEFYITAAGATAFLVIGVLCGQRYGAYGVAVASATMTVAVALARRVAVELIMRRIRRFS